MSLSTIYLRQRITNADRRFGGAPEYLPVLVVDEQGTERWALLTDDAIRKGIERAGANPEDVARALALSGALTWHLLQWVLS
jgi:hypothetical protein